MKQKRRIVAIVLLVLLGATIYGLVRTGSQSPFSSGNGTTGEGTTGPAGLVDQTPLLTAQRLARMPISTEEFPFAQEALRLGDLEMDLAFAAAVIDTTEHPPVLSAAAKEIQARLQTREDALAAQQAELAQLTAADAKASGSRKDALDDQLDVAKARLELAQDEVDDAKQDMIRAGGDPQGRIQALVQEHQAASQASDTTKVAVSAPTAARGLVNRLQQWSALHEKQSQLSQAKQDAASIATTLAMKHNSLEQQIGAQKEKSPGTVATNSASTAIPGGQSGGPTRQESAAMVNTAKLRAADQKMLANFDKRIDNEKQLANVYGKWIDVVAGQKRSVVNRALYGVLIILMIAIIGLFVDGWIERLLGKMPMDRRRVATLRAVTRVTLQIVAVLLILLVIFGPPNQLGTILGLAGAGLTVALKDFIVGFFGWFVLMGKDGIRLGDWVEINGVTGEVVQLGMFHTVLLETGNWTDSGHPTGRRVTFTNSFAIEGHYFNFSTSGQWLWDELQIVLPAGNNPYPIVDAIKKKVVEMTSESARQAEQEWRGAAKSRDMNALSAAPAITVKPVIGGTQISVRYITRAHERSQLRAQLNHAAVDLLGEGLATRSASLSPQSASTPS
ncbi:MAG TPA: mechanosensitive ion channel domain-containing protein [Terriglobales bacterium]|jgi:small-conductance mechanosensitive channel|nr:mechanosensitive ion channel domain-containing protein [Terriglobales bacterium]